jgi:hypothetical protein
MSKIPGIPYSPTSVPRRVRCTKARSGLSPLPVNTKASNSPDPDKRLAVPFRLKLVADATLDPGSPVQPKEWTTSVSSGCVRLAVARPGATRVGVKQSAHPQGAAPRVGKSACLLAVRFVGCVLQGLRRASRPLAGIPAAHGLLEGAMLGSGALLAGSRSAPGAVQ